MIPLTYVCLALTVCSCLIASRRRYPVGCTLITLGVAGWQQILDWQGVLVLSGFYGVLSLFFNAPKKYVAYRVILLLLITILSLGFYAHLLPGFHNVLVVPLQKLSPQATEFRMFLNFDKAMAAVIFWLQSRLSQQEALWDKKVIYTTCLGAGLCSVTLIGLALLCQYVTVDIKIPDILPVWILNNLLFVCFAEETLFRGGLQKNLHSLIQSQYGAVFMTAILFALLHFQGGWCYVMLSGLAGIFYGLTYAYTQSVRAALVVHFSLNLVHLLFFTYPAWQSP